MKGEKVLLVDLAINLILGVVLLVFSRRVIQLLGVPMSEHSFYPNILGAVLLGIGIALLVEYFRSPGGIVGLGLGGAIAINLCGGFVLAAWLVSGKLHIPFRGLVLLWALVFLLIFISGAELLVHRVQKKRDFNAC
jgi:hypothetical protein